MNTIKQHPIQSGLLKGAEIGISTALATVAVNVVFAKMKGQELNFQEIAQTAAWWGGGIGVIAGGKKAYDVHHQNTRNLPHAPDAHVDARTCEYMDAAVPLTPEKSFHMV